MLLLAALSGVTLGLNLLPRTELRDRNHAGVAAVAASGPDSMRAFACAVGVIRRRVPRRCASEWPARCVASRHECKWSTKSCALPQRNIACSPQRLQPHLHRDWAHPCHICTGAACVRPAARATGSCAVVLNRARCAMHIIFMLYCWYMYVPPSELQGLHSKGSGAMPLTRPASHSVLSVPIVRNVLKGGNRTASGRARADLPPAGRVSTIKWWAIGERDLDCSRLDIRRSYSRWTVLACAFRCNRAALKLVRRAVGR